MNRKIGKATELITDYLDTAGGSETGFALVLYHPGRTGRHRISCSHTLTANPHDIALMLRQMAARLEGQPETPPGNA